MDRDPNDLCVLQACKDAIQDPRLRPAVHAGVDGVPTAKPLGQNAPLAALLGNVEDRVQDVQIRQRNVAALARKAVFDQGIVGFR